MATSEGVKRLLALAVVAAGVAAQTSVTRGVVAERQTETPRFAVSLLETELAIAPSFTARVETTLELTAMPGAPSSASPTRLPAPKAVLP